MSNVLHWLEAGISIACCEELCPLDRLETRLLLVHALSLTRVQLITQSETCLNAAQAKLLQTLLQRRMHGEPIAYIVGEREFFGLSFAVSPAVLIPRPDTELLVELALQLAPPHNTLLDLGTGSGAIAVAIAHTRPDIHVTAADLSTAALSIAQTNAIRHLDHLASTRVAFIQSDWFSNIPAQQFGTIVSNPPYIVRGDAHLVQGDLRFEPINALTDHADGLSAYRQIITGAATHLQADGWLLFEHGYDQAEAVRALLLAHAYHEVQSWNDLAGIARVSGGRRRVP